MIIKTSSNPYKLIDQDGNRAYHALSELPKWKRHGYVFRLREEFNAKLSLTPNQEKNMIQVEDLNTGNRYWMMSELVSHLKGTGQFENGITEGRWTTQQTGNLYHIVKL